MKDSHKATKFFVEFYQLASLLKYNDEALYRRAYLALPKRIKDEMVHFNKPHTLNWLRDLIQKIDQCYWEHKSKVSRETSLTPKQEVKNDRSNKSNQNSGRQNQAGLSLSNANANTSSNSNGNAKEKDKSKASNSQPKKTDYSDMLGKDGKLTPQERQRCFDNKLCLVCGQAGHIATACLKATKARTAKATSRKATETSSESTAKVSEAKN